MAKRESVEDGDAMVKKRLKTTNTSDQRDMVKVKTEDLDVPDACDDPTQGVQYSASNPRNRRDQGGIAKTKRLVAITLAFLSLAFGFFYTADSRHAGRDALAFCSQMFNRKFTVPWHGSHHGPDRVFLSTEQYYQWRKAFIYYRHKCQFSLGKLRRLVSEEDYERLRDHPKGLGMDTAKLTIVLPGTILAMRSGPAMRDLMKGFVTTTKANAEWDRKLPDVVMKSNFYKFRQHSNLLAKLLNTGDRFLVKRCEDGCICRCGAGVGSGDQAIERRSHWCEDVLGKALMSIRAQFGEDPDAQQPWDQDLDSFSDGRDLSGYELLDFIRDQELLPQ